MNLRQVGIQVEFIHDGSKRIIIIRKEPLIPLEPLVDENHAQKTLDKPENPNNINDTNDMPNHTNDIPLAKNDENHAQNTTTNDINDTNDTLRGIKGEDKNN